MHGHESFEARPGSGRLEGRNAMMPVEVQVQVQDRQAKRKGRRDVGDRPKCCKRPTCPASEDASLCSESTNTPSSPAPRCHASAPTQAPGSHTMAAFVLLELGSPHRREEGGWRQRQVCYRCAVQLPRLSTPTRMPVQPCVHAHAHAHIRFRPYTFTPVLSYAYTP